jgi:hypothetical protein
MASSSSRYSDEFWDSKSVEFQGKGKCLPAYWKDSGELYIVSVMFSKMFISISEFIYECVIKMFLV